MKSNFIKSFGILLLSLVVLTGCRNEDNKIDCTCFDEVKNQGELRVDCGGPNCPECPPSCEDRIWNQDEQSPVSLTNPNVLGIDCGGDECIPCSTCEDGVQNAHWVRNLNLVEEDLQYDSVGQDIGGNLYNLVWETGIDCGFPCPFSCAPACDDGIQNGDEAGVDCGGTCADPCPTPNCVDGIQNGTETGIDCGDSPEPSICGPCPANTCSDGIQNIHIEVSEMFFDGYIVVVETGIDCDDNPNTSCPDCPIPSCFDGIQNGIETGVDCGGNCITQCDPLVNCNNGIMDGDETGIDCDDDPTTTCPTCPTCDDLILNGAEFDVDCVDYPIPALPGCMVCPSCHDEFLNSIYNPGDLTGMLELDVDCGTPDCGPCMQELVVEDIGGDGSTSGFRDQYSYNLLQSAVGITDTLELDHNQYPGLKVEKFTAGFSGPAYLKVTANQGIETATLGIYMRTITMYIPWPESMVTVNPFFGPATAAEMLTMFDSQPIAPGACDPPVQGQERPYLIYREQLIDNPGTLNRCFFSYVDEPENSMLSIDYLLGYLQSEYYTKGGINQGSLLYEPIPLPGVLDIEGSFTNLTFKFQYPFIL